MTPGAFGCPYPGSLPSCTFFDTPATELKLKHYLWVPLSGNPPVLLHFKDPYQGSEAPALLLMTPVKESSLSVSFWTPL